jgi:RNA polymerase sigma-B factor
MAATVHDSTLLSNSTSVDLSDVGARAAYTRALFAALAETSPDDRERREQILTRMAEFYEPVVSQLARRYGRRGADHDELRQVGYVGLMKAINNYEVERGDLMPYAVSTILGEIKRHFRDRCWAIRPTRRIQELELQLASARTRLEQQLGREPSLGDLADHLGESLGDVTAAVHSNTLFRLLSTDATTGDSNAATIGESVGHDDGGYLRAEAGAIIRSALARTPLSERDRRVLAMRFFEDLTQREIAQVIGTTQMQVSRILTRALSRLRDDIGSMSA